MSNWLLSGVLQITAIGNGKVYNILRCGNVASILELDENLGKQYKIFEAAPQESRGLPAKKPIPDYFL